MTTILQFLIQSIPVFLSFVIPGFLLALALFRKELGYVELFFLGIVLGITIPALLGFMEFLVGIQFSLQLHLINLALITLVSIVLLVKNKTSILPNLKPSKNTIYGFIALGIILFLAWWIRVQAMSPYFYEFDPYWYNTITELIINQGGVPVSSDNAWWPNQYSYRNFVIVSYAEAGWYHIFSAFNGLTTFDFNTMTMISSLYPPIAALLMCFFAYLWMSKEYGKAIGILAAGLIAFTPVIVDKTVAGEFELQPWGLFTAIFFLAFYTLALKNNNRKFAILAALAIMVGFLGSGTGKILIFPLIAASSLFAIIKFLKNELDINFIYTNLIFAAGALLGTVLYTLYVLPLWGLTGVSTIVMIFAFAGLLGILLYLQSIIKTMEEKILYLTAMLVVGLILITVTPLKDSVSELAGLFVSVVSYTDPTFQTIAEQIVTGSSLHSALGIFGVDISNFSIAPFILILFAVPLVMSVIFGMGVYALIGLIIVVPIAATGLFKVKYSPYSGLFMPLLLCFAIGESVKNKTLAKYKVYFIALASVLLLIQAAGYYDIILSSVGIVGNVDITKNSALSATCSSKYQEIVDASKGINTPIIGETIFRAKQLTQRTYCNRIPDHWINAMYWLRDSTQLDDRTISWWDYGHWITTFAQRKSVTDNTHWYTKMHQEVADKFVTNTPAALTQYMKEHKAKYMLLDEDLIGGIGGSDSIVGKWGALVYHSCFYNNKTKIELGPGRSDCDKENIPEIIQIPIPSSSTIRADQLCSYTDNGKATFKAYSSYGAATSGYYCISSDTLNTFLSSLQYSTYAPLSLTYEDGTVAGINGALFRSASQTGYALFIATYPSNSPERKGKFYDSIFYKAFFEGVVPGFTQVYPSTPSNQPNIPVRIYKLND